MSKREIICWSDVNDFPILPLRFVTIIVLLPFTGIELQSLVGLGKGINLSATLLSATIGVGPIFRAFH
jgi:hypothetical protein